MICQTKFSLYVFRLKLFMVSNFIRFGVYFCDMKMLLLYSLDIFSMTLCWLGLQLPSCLFFQFGAKISGLICAVEEMQSMGRFSARVIRMAAVNETFLSLSLSLAFSIHFFN